MKKRKMKKPKISLLKRQKCCVNILGRAEVAELADALDSKSCEGNFVWVRVPPSAPEKNLKRFFF